MNQIMICRILVTLLTAWAFQPEAFAQDVATLYSSEGTVEGRKAQSGSWAPVTKGSKFAAGDAVRTGDASRAAIVNAEGMMVRINANGLLEFKAASGGSGAALHVAKGDTHFLSRDPQKVPNVTTSIVSGSIRGTEFAVSARDNDVTFSVMSGTVQVANQFGDVTLVAGEEANTKRGEAPKKRLMVRPFDAVQWALSYPALVSVEPFRKWVELGDPSFRADFDALASRAEKRPLFAGNSAQALLGRALTAYVYDGPAAAMAISKSDATGRDPGLMLLNSGLALETGQLDAATSQHAHAESTLQNSTTTAARDLRAVLDAQRAIVAIVQNRRDDAEKMIAASFEYAANNETATYGRSVLEQSRGDVAAASETVDSLLAGAPKNSKYLARAAELAFGRGEVRDAERLVAEALQHNPLDTDARTVAGFIALSRGEIDLAIERFSAALNSDDSNASAHLGLGISTIRRGNLEEGRYEIQKAAHLEPTVGLYRSYLGKAFFEAEREGEAAEELSIAMKLDPLDPTPHLYASFNELASFKPVLALEHLEDAIERNDNRAVYRSRLLLDQDQATRGTGLGRIFNALDFVNPARIEALKSLAEDPTNYSAHLLLKDALIGAETDRAAVQEEVTATLLSPSTFSAILPTASGSASLNDYTTLFERSQGRFALDVIGQSREELLQTSEVYFAGGDDYSYLLRHGSTYGNGYRDDDYERTETGRLLAQYDLTPEDKILGEVIGTWSEFGDRGQGLDPDTNDPDQDFDVEDYTARTGYRHSFGTSQLIGQALLVNSKFRLHDSSQERSFGVALSDGGVPVEQFEDSAVFDVVSRIRTKGFRGDLQHLWSSELLTQVSGVSFLSFRDAQDESSFAATDDAGILQDIERDSSAEIGAQSSRVYSYTTVKPTRWLRAVGGVSYDDITFAPTSFEPFVDQELDRARWNPKVGLMLLPGGDVTVRASYVQGLGIATARELEGLEPSQVAGIRQVFDDPVGTQHETYGLGVDWKLPKSTYLGTEYRTRRLNSPSTSVEQGVVADFQTGVEFDDSVSFLETHNDEQVVSTYLNQIIYKELVGSIEHDWIRSEDNFSAFEITTNRLRLGLNYFHPAGWFSFGSATYRDQEREGFVAPGMDDGSDFWIMSAGMGYQLPHRHGSIQFAARNILDEDFRYVPTGSDVTLYPGVDFALSFSVNF